MGQSELQGSPPCLSETLHKENTKINHSFNDFNMQDCCHNQTAEAEQSIHNAKGPGVGSEQLSSLQLI